MPNSFLSLIVLFKGKIHYNLSLLVYNIWNHGVYGGMHNFDICRSSIEGSMYFSVLNSSNVECSKHTYFMIKIHIFLKYLLQYLKVRYCHFSLWLKIFFFKFHSLFDTSCIAVFGKAVPYAANIPTKHPLFLRY